MIIQKYENFYNSFIDELEAKGEKAIYLWETNDNKGWTRMITKLISDVLETVNDDIKELQTAGIGTTDSYEQSEYLSIDVTAYSDQDWGPLIWAVEHENVLSKSKIQYCTWKLLNVKSRYKVLICYFQPSSVVCASSFKQLRNFVHEVVQKYLEDNIFIIGGNWRGEPRKNGWRSIYQYFLNEV